MNEVLMCGEAHFVTQEGGNRITYTCNFGARVTVPHEPSLTKFANAIIGEEKDRGRAMQKLLSRKRLDAHPETERKERSKAEVDGFTKLRSFT